MSPKKTISTWLSSEYDLIIRNTENFAEKQTFKFTYAKIIAFIVLVFIFFTGSSLFLTKTILARFLDPQYEQQKLTEDIINIQNALDSLERHMHANELKANTLHNILNGKDPTTERQETSVTPDVSKLNEDINYKLQPVDSVFRLEMEKMVTESKQNMAQNNAMLARNLLFIPPLRVMSVSSTFNLNNQHMGIDLLSKKNDPVIAIADGTVIFADEQINSGFVIILQHADGFLSVYKHNSSLLKSEGDVVKAGDIISKVGSTGHQSQGTHLHFELWYKGIPLDPAEFLGL